MNRWYKECQRKEEIMVEENQIKVIQQMWFAVTVADKSERTKLSRNLILEILSKGPPRKISSKCFYTLKWTFLNHTLSTITVFLALAMPELSRLDQELIEESGMSNKSSKSRNPSLQLKTDVIEFHDIIRR